MKTRKKSQVIKDSPVEMERKNFPQGDGKWPGFSHVYEKLQEAALAIAKNPNLYLSDEHIRVMTILGCGHEETMKDELARCYSRGFIKP